MLYSFLTIWAVGLLGVVPVDGALVVVTGRLVVVAGRLVVVVGVALVG